LAFSVFPCIGLNSQLFEICFDLLHIIWEAENSYILGSNQLDYFSHFNATHTVKRIVPDERCEAVCDIPQRISLPTFMYRLVDLSGFFFHFQSRCFQTIKYWFCSQGSINTVVIDVHHHRITPTNGQEWGDPYTSHAWCIQLGVTPHLISVIRRQTPF